MTNYPRNQTTGVDAGRLWAGGAATALVAALVAIAGLLIARGLFNAEVLAPKAEGLWGNASTTKYALIAAGVALAATGLMHLLSVATPAPGQFFGWIMMLLTLIAVVLPLTLAVQLNTKIATAAINLAIGVTITLVISSMAANARKLKQQRDRGRRGADPYAPTQQYTRYRDDPPESQYYR